MKHYLRALAFVSSTCLAGVSVAEESGVTITPMFGHTWYGSELELDDARNVSVAAGYKFSAPIALELAYLKASPNFADTDNSVDLDQVRLDSLYYFAESEIRPFVLLGVGQQDVVYQGVESSTAIFNAGLGVRAELANSFAFRGDVRAIMLEGMDTDYGMNIGFQWFIGTGGTSSEQGVSHAPKDSDRDGVKDSIDNCPSTPTGTKVDATGCAMVMDDDGDGVANNADKCPGSEAGAKVDELGCYVVISEDVTVSLNVNFANNSEEMVSGTEQIGKVAAFMKQYPLTNVVIEGHTDSLGAAAYNQDLSQRRAQAVVNELTSTYGIAVGRVSAMGYGESKPIASNDTNEGRAANRRVSAVVKASVEKVAK